MQPAQLDRNILCFSWNAARDQVAISPHTNQLHIFAAPTTPAGEWTELHTFADHDLVVSGVHWGPLNDRIATCSHDRNVFVYDHSPQAGRTGWQQQLVRTRVSKAALCVQWSPSETKLAVGSGDSGVHICHYEASSRWWLARAIKGRHTSSVVALAWHPTQSLVATASTDGTCRIFTAHIPEVDGSAAPGETSGFGQQLWEVRPNGGSWVHGVCWDLQGRWLACCTHSSRVLLYRDPSPEAQERHHGQADSEVEVTGLPLKVLRFTAAGDLLAGGWGGRVQLLQRRSDAGWHVVALEPVAGATCNSSRAAAAAAAGATGEWLSSRVADVQQELKLQQLGGARNAPPSPRARAEAAPAAAALGIRTTSGHSKCIVGLELMSMQGKPGSKAQGSLLSQVCSAGLDGRLLFWSLPLAS